MSLLALELSDIGVMVAGANPERLLEIDGGSRESPGYALDEKKKLLVGKAAERKSHLNPRRVNNLFWDQLSTEPLAEPHPHAQNHAEVACAHLALIWEQIKGYGSEVVLAVPGFYHRDHLGLILGMAAELSMPIKGFIDLAVASSSQPRAESLLFHLDIHLHRLALTYLEQGDHLALRDSATATGKGLDHLYSEWMRSIADEFVRMTRFDPLHQAASEQELYDRLPDALDEFQRNPFAVLEMSGGHKTHRVTLAPDLLAQKSEAVLRELRWLIDDMRDRHGKPGANITLQASHRISRLPGWKEMLKEMPALHLIELEPGAGALGALRLWADLPVQQTGRGVSFFSSRPWQTTPATVDQALAPTPHPTSRPSHVLYRSLAYPISERPLAIGTGGDLDEVGLKIQGEAAGVAPKHCTIQLRGADVVLVDHSGDGTLVDGTPISGSAVLQLGQVIRLGTAGEELHLIACVETDET